MTHGSLLTSWQSRLAECQHDLANGHSRWPWLLQVQIRVLTFMVGRYAGAASSILDPLNGSKSLAGRDVFVRDLPSQPVLPKDAERIRSTLDTVHEARGETQTGPLTAGLPPEHPVVVTVVRNWNEAAYVRRLLQASNISANLQPVRRGVEVVVRYADLADSHDALRAQGIHPELAKPDVARFKRNAGLGLLGMAFGMVAALGVVAAVLEQGRAPSPSHVLQVTYVCTIVGGLLGLLCSVRAYSR